MSNPRKLLVLDLNGTLLVRTKRRQKRADITSTLEEVRARLPIVHSRPYFPSFRDYIFHPETRKWLDVMIWSSAQPHSVANMVGHCFPETEEREGLLAVWARDTCDLDRKAYSKKSQTTKDLAKPWAAFPKHSAATTLLLDDSPRKARLQPRNHICVPNYVAQLRSIDLEVWKWNRWAHQSSKKGSLRSREVLGHSAVGKDMSSIAQDAAPLASVTAVPRLQNCVYKYDETLLAVVGILNELKDQADVSEWIHMDGLWGGALPSIPNSGHAIQEEDEITKVPRANLRKVNRNGYRDRGLDTMATNHSAAALRRISDDEEVEKPLLWFEDKGVMNFWAVKGKHVLEDLVIDVVSGIEG